MTAPTGPSLLRPRRYATIVAVTLALGVVVTSFWLATADLGELRATTESICWWWVPVLPALTLVNLAIRFLRWNFLLRRIHAFVPLRENLQVFLASLSMVMTPLHCGEAIKALLLRNRAGTPVRQSGAVVVAERFFDFLALVLIWAVTVPEHLSLALPLGALLLAAGWLFSRKLGGLAARLQADVRQATVKVRLQVAAVNFMRQLRPAAFLGGLALSLVAWLAAALVLSAATIALGITGHLRNTVSVFAIATPLGALTLVPGGVGVTGSLMNAQLQGLGISFEQAAVAVILTRLATFWFASGIGALYLMRMVRRGDLRARLDQGLHFDDMSDSYEAEIPEHMRSYLLEKKIAQMAPWLANLDRVRGLDLGCGQGWYAREFETRGARVIGLDYSIGQLRQARAQGASGPLVLADTRSIPLRSESVDFAYCVNMLHHIVEGEAQLEAVREMLRVLRPGGQLFLHEINVTNPLFRFYMGYVFPLINNIDLGTERWILPSRLPVVAGATVEKIDYFTFLPDFLPRSLFRCLLPLERRLECSRFRRFSAHYMAVFRKEPSLAGAVHAPD
ncbi:MAG: flippase-like domain-containing protein [Planctomycetota bacterium]